MNFVFGALEIVAVWGLHERWSHRSPRPAGTPVLPRIGLVAAARGADAIGGWLLGHEMGHHGQGFPGAPLSLGHLGSPADLAFWAGVLDEEAEALDEAEDADCEEDGDDESEDVR